MDRPDILRWSGYCEEWESNLRNLCPISLISSRYMSLALVLMLSVANRYEDGGPVAW